MTESIDQAARDLGREAMAAVARHEAVCTERYSEIRSQYRDLKELLTGEESPVGKLKADIATLYNRLWAGALSIIGVLGSLCAFAFAKLLHLI